MKDGTAILILYAGIMHTSSVVVYFLLQVNSLIPMQVQELLPLCKEGNEREIPPYFMCSLIPT